MQVDERVGRRLAPQVLVKQHHLVQHNQRANRLNGSSRFSKSNTTSSGNKTSGTPRKTFCCDKCGSVPVKTPHMWCLARRVAISILHSASQPTSLVQSIYIAHLLHPRRTPCDWTRAAGFCGRRHQSQRPSLYISAHLTRDMPEGNGVVTPRHSNRRVVQRSERSSTTSATTSTARSPRTGQLDSTGTDTAEQRLHLALWDGREM